jgi:hypothetical protein
MAFRFHFAQCGPFLGDLLFNPIVMPIAGIQLPDASLQLLEALR